MMPLHSVSIVIPVYKAGRVLFELHTRLIAVLEKIAENFEIIFVEDCGGDDSWNYINEIVSSDSRVRGFQLARNYGQHNAILCGIREAKGEYIITLDDDLQNPPEEIPKLINKLQMGFDVVYGHPERETHGFLRNIASRITKYALQGAMGVDCANKVSAFRIFKTRLRNGFLNYASPSVNIEVLLTWATTKFSFVSVRQDERKTGESGYTLKKLSAHAINMMTGFSTLPLQIASVLGLIFGLVGFLILCYVVVHYVFLGSRVPGFSFLASIICIFSGVQLFALGVIGEYLARMHFRSMNRPPYVKALTTDTE